MAAQLDVGALGECAAEKVDALRLACYDREVRGALSPLPAASELDAGSDVKVQERFGARGGELARKKALEEEKIELKEVTAQIVTLSQRPRGERVFTLNNGQVWVEKRRASYLPVKVGDTVTIEAGALSSYRLSEPSGRSTQVQRIQ